MTTLGSRGSPTREGYGSQVGRKNVDGSEEEDGGLGKERGDHQGQPPQEPKARRLSDKLEVTRLLGGRAGLESRLPDSPSSVFPLECVDIYDIPRKMAIPTEAHFQCSLSFAPGCKIFVLLSSVWFFFFLNSNI